jgi:hypothetical protein
VWQRGIPPCVSWPSYFTAPQALPAYHAGRKVFFEIIRKVNNIAFVVVKRRHLQLFQKGTTSISASTFRGVSQP